MHLGDRLYGSVALVLGVLALLAALIVFWRWIASGRLYLSDRFYGSVTLVLGVLALLAALIGFWRQIASGPLHTDVKPLMHYDFVGEHGYVPLVDYKGLTYHLVHPMQRRVGNIAFNVITSMEEGEVREVRLLLSMTEPITELQYVLESGYPITDTEGAVIRVSEVMEARLVGEGLGVVPVTVERQAVDFGELTEWRWLVKAGEPGEHRLFLVVNTFLSVGGMDAMRSVGTFSKTINVSVSLRKRVYQFVSTNWEWMWAAILVPITPFLWRCWERVVRNRSVNKRRPVNNAKRRR